MKNRTRQLFPWRPDRLRARGAGQEALEWQCSRPLEAWRRYTRRRCQGLPQRSMNKDHRASRRGSLSGTLDYSRTTFKSRDHARNITIWNLTRPRHRNIMNRRHTLHRSRFCCDAPIGAYTRPATTPSSLGGSRRLGGHHQPGALPGPRDPIPIGHVRTGSGAYVFCAAVGLYRATTEPDPGCDLPTPHRPVLKAHGLSYWRITRETFDR